MKNTLAARGLAAFIALSGMIGAPMTMHSEGMELAPYYDGVGVRTWCAGETEVGGDKDSYTYEECGLLFHMRYGYYSMRVAAMYNDVAKKVVTPEIHAAFTDMAYNVGLGAVGSSSMMRHINASRPTQACNAILLYKYAGGHDCSAPGNKVCAGVWGRRLEMNKLCLSGI